MANLDLVDAGNSPRPVVSYDHTSTITIQASLGRAHIPST